MTTTGKNRIMIFGPKTDGTYVVEFRTAEGESLAISIPKTETAVIRHFQERCRMGSSCRMARRNEDRTPTHSYEPTREAAMAAFAKSWRRGVSAEDRLGSGDLLPPSPPAEKATARQDQARKSSTGDGGGNANRRDREVSEACFERNVDGVVAEHAIPSFGHQGTESYWLGNCPILGKPSPGKSVSEGHNEVEKGLVNT
jgi:hypothetical protein